MCRSADGRDGCYGCESMQVKRRATVGGRHVRLSEMVELVHEFGRVKIIPWVQYAWEIYAVML